MNLMEASSQWANRPDDERFGSLGELAAFCEASRAGSRAATVDPRRLRLSPGADGREILVGYNGDPSARFSHWSFGQLARLVGAPSEYLSRLPAPLAIDNLRHGLEPRAAEVGDLRMLAYGGNGQAPLIRAWTSERYTRIWNADVTRRLTRLSESGGWRVAPARPARPGQAGTRPATGEDVLNAGAFNLSVNVGDLIAPAGLYAGDRDMFVFLVDPSRPISDGAGHPLYRGFFCWNSEVGAATFGLLTFLWAHVCGNHIVWGAQQVREVNIRHVGQADGKAWSQLAVAVREYADSSAGEDERRIKSARELVLGRTKDEVLDAVFGMRLGLSRAALGSGWELGSRYAVTDGDPRTAWGLANGLTRYSQTLVYAGARVDVDRAAGALLTRTVGK